MPAEVSLATASELPKFIAGGYTSVLPNAKKIFNNIHFTAFVLPMNKINTKYIESIKKTYEHFEEDGIEIIELPHLL